MKNNLRLFQRNKSKNDKNNNNLNSKNEQNNNNNDKYLILMTLFRK